MQPTLPAVLTETRAVEASRYPMWVARELEPSERVKVEQALAQLHGRFRRAPMERILAHLGRMFAQWDSNTQSDAVKEIVLEDFASDLAEFSEAHVAEVCIFWRRTQTYKPRIAEFLAEMHRVWTRDAESVRRCRVLLGLEKPKFWEVIPEKHEPAPLTQDARARMNAALKRLSPAMAAAARSILSGNGADLVPAPNQRKAG